MTPRPWGRGPWEAAVDSGQRPTGRAEPSRAVARLGQHAPHGPFPWPHTRGRGPPAGFSRGMGSVAPRVFAEQLPGGGGTLGPDHSTERADTHRLRSAARAGRTVALPRPGAPLTPAPAPADLSDLAQGTRGGRASGAGPSSQPRLGRPSEAPGSRAGRGVKPRYPPPSPKHRRPRLRGEGLPAGPDAPESLFLVRFCTCPARVPECVSAARLRGGGDSVSRDDFFL